jgi:hypothetical protein
MNATTSVGYQKEENDKQQLNKSVRQLCLKDLEETIVQIKNKYHGNVYIMVMLDANETIEEQGSGIKTLWKN